MAIARNTETRGIRTGRLERLFGRKQRRRARVQINVRVRSRAVLIGALLLVRVCAPQKDGLHLLRIQQLRHDAKVATELDELGEAQRFIVAHQVFKRRFLGQDGLKLLSRGTGKVEKEQLREIQEQRGIMKRFDDDTPWHKSQICAAILAFGAA